MRAMPTAMSDAAAMSPSSFLTMWSETAAASSTATASTHFSRSPSGKDRPQAGVRWSGRCVSRCFRRDLNRYLRVSSLAIAAVKPPSDTGMVTGLRVTDSMPMFRLVPDFIALTSSGDKGVAA